MMTRKHYVAFAQAIKENTMNDTQPIINKDRFIKDLCEILILDNNNFNYSRFINACNERGEG